MTSDAEWKPLDLIRTTTEYLTNKGVPSARLDAELLLSQCLECKRLELYTSFERPLTRTEVDAFRELVRRRAAREPVSRILGEREFMSLAYQVTPAVLSPRPETEILVEEAIHILNPKASVVRGDAPKPSAIAQVPEGEGAQTVLDLGTGSGCIGVSIAAYCPQVRVILSDISAEALLVARENAERNGVWSQVDFREGDMFGVCWEDETFDLIASNPPYLVKDDPEIWPEVREYDPPLALYGGSKGLDYYARIAVEAPTHLNAGGHLLIEIGQGQNEAVCGMLEEEGKLAVLRTLDDHAGIPRVVVAQRQIC